MKIVKLLSSGWGTKYAMRALAIGLLAVLTWGCGGKIPQMHYYTLKVPPPSPAPVAEPKTTYMLEVEPFRSAPNLRDDRIPYYESPTEFNFYDYHRWSPEPTTMITELAARHLESMAVFSQVRLSPTHQLSDYLLKGRLLNFEELDYEPGGKARVALELTLVRTLDHKTVWADTRQLEQAIEKKGVAGVVEALNAATEQLLSQALPGMTAEVERESKETPVKLK